MAKELVKNYRTLEIHESVAEEEEEDEEEEELEDWEDWRADDNEEEEGGSESELLCLFCNNKYSSCGELFEHCSKSHCFNFHGIKNSLGLDFYGCFKLINYVRSQVAEIRCWTCGFTCQSIQDLQNHLHAPATLDNIKLLLDDDKYLKPIMPEDSLLYSFGEDEEGEEYYTRSVDYEELHREMGNLDEVHINDENLMEMVASSIPFTNKALEEATSFNGNLNLANSLDEVKVNGTHAQAHTNLLEKKPKDKHLRVSFANVVAKEIKNVNDNYFGAYSSFGIHREMISDKVRMDAYRQAILSNPSLLNGAVALDVGCGTGILSLFAAQAGASRVIAVEASDKMAAVATKIAKENGLLCDGSPQEGNNQCSGVIRVVQGMVEELDRSVEIQPHSVDVLLSEWMGYCLLYETMLSSVLFARDKWLKPGGAILPDTATIFVAGFGIGGTSIPFWENVYGFNMSYIGKELLEDAAQNPIVDVVDEHDIVTNPVVLQTFDMATMKPEEMDFTASIELEPIAKIPACTSADPNPNATWCYGLVLWFETGFTSRFCKEKPSVLSTSPYTPRTHWAQTIFTFREPIAISAGESNFDSLAAVGTEACPARRIQSRISIARASQHRSIDVSLEIVGIGPDRRKRSWPVQIFNLS